MEGAGRGAGMRAMSSVADEAESDGNAPPPPPPAPPGEAAASEVAAAPARKVFYEGLVHLKSAHPEETLDAARALALGMGGRVERLAGDVVVLRVPVERFDEAVAAVRAFGDVVHASITAQDVTEAYTDTDLRLRTLRVTQERLAALLAKSRDESEKLSLIAELQRVQEQIDAMDAKLRTLASLSSLSRLTVQVSPRDAVSTDQGLELAGFEWIAALDPFDRSVPEGPRVNLPAPDGLVVLSKNGPWRAEGPDGVVMWTQERDNEPAGDGAYWVSAVVERLGPSFASATPREIGAWSCVLFVHEAEAPYTWQVCVLPRGRKLDVSETWFPDPTSWERHGSAVAAALTGGES